MASPDSVLIATGDSGAAAGMAVLVMVQQVRGGGNGIAGSGGNHCDGDDVGQVLCTTSFQITLLSGESSQNNLQLCSECCLCKDSSGCSLGI